MKKIKLTCAHAIIKHLIAQKILIDGKKEQLFAGAFGIFGHGNVACLGQALQENHDFLVELVLNKQHCHVQKYQKLQQITALFYHLLKFFEQ